MKSRLRKSTKMKERKEGGGGGREHIFKKIIDTQEIWPNKEYVARRSLKSIYEY